MLSTLNRFADFGYRSIASTLLWETTNQRLDNFRPPAKPRPRLSRDRRVANAACPRAGLAEIPWSRSLPSLPVQGRGTAERPAPRAPVPAKEERRRTCSAVRAAPRQRDRNGAPSSRTAAGWLLRTLLRHAFVNRTPDRSTFPRGPRAFWQAPSRRRGKPFPEPLLEHLSDIAG